MAKIKLKTDSITLSFAYDDFIKHCVVKNLSSSTIKTYKAENYKFIEFNGLNEPCAALCEESLIRYIYQCRIDNNSDVYVQTKVRQIRAFLYYCMSKKWCNPFKVTMPKANEIVKEPYTPAELEILIKEPVGTTSFVEYRTWAAENLLIATGIRLGTLLSIKISDVDFNNRTIILQHLKNRKVQIVPMSSQLTIVLKRYLSLWDYTSEDYLIPNTNTGGPIKQRSMQDDVITYNRSRGVNKTSIHLFRHTYAKQFIINGGDALMLQRLLGHSTLTMTNHYVALYSNDLSKGYDSLCPLDNITKK